MEETHDIELTLKERAEQIRDEFRNGANTAERVGGVLVGILDIQEDMIENIGEAKHTKEEAEKAVSGAEAVDAKLNGTIITVTSRDGKKTTADIRGPKGERGQVGPQGERGERGYTGPQGERGPVGPKGEQGMKGERGVPGIDGKDGPQGLQGPQGERGLQGDQGLQGPQGERGPQGPQGERGPVGPQGEKGERGERGYTGAQGERGERGPQGERGLQGPVGATGPQGERGLQGPQGEKGERGERGYTGAQGERGPQGIAGAQGERGPVGATGPQGERGIQGPKGDRGDDANWGSMTPEQKEQAVAALISRIDADGVIIERVDQQLHNIAGIKSFLGIFNNKNAAIRNWIESGMPKAAYCIVGDIVRANVYCISSNTDLWDPTYDGDTPDQITYLGSFESKQKAAEAWAAKSLITPVSATVNATVYYIDVDYQTDILGEKINDKPIDITDSEGLYKTAEAAREAKFNAAQEERATKFNAAETSRTSTFNSLVNGEGGVNETLQNMKDLNEEVSSAEETRKSYESARQIAENWRETYESQRQSAETARAAAETERGRAEQSRESGERSRESGEKSRSNAEKKRVEDENSRAQAEAMRDSSFGHMMEAAEAAEQDRKDTFLTNETNRQNEFERKEETRDAANAAAMEASEKISELEGNSSVSRQDENNCFSICDQAGNIIVKFDDDGHVMTKSFDSRRVAPNNSIGRTQFPKIDFNKPTFRWLDIGNSHSNCALFYLRSIAISQGVDLSNVAVCRVSRGGSSFEDWYNGYHDKDTSGQGDELTGGMYNLVKDFGELGVHVKGNKYTQVNGTPIPIDMDVTRSSITWWGGDCSLLRSLLADNEWDLITIHQRYVLNGLYDESEGWTKDLEGYTYNNTGKSKEFIRILKTLNPRATIGTLYTLNPYGYSDIDNKVLYTENSWQRTKDCFEAWNKNIMKFLTDSGIELIVPCNTALMNLRESSVANTPDEWTGNKMNLLTRWGFNYDQAHTAFGVAGYTMAAVAWEVIFAPRFGKSIYGNSLRELKKDDTHSSSTYYLRPSYINNDGQRVVVDVSDGAWNKPAYAGVTTTDGGTTWQAGDRSTSVIRVTDDNAKLCQMAAIMAVDDMWRINNPNEVEI